MAYLYEIIFPNGRKYIGITTKSVESRFKLHLKDAVAGSQFIVHKALRKHREGVVVRTILEAEWNYVADMERKVIAAYGTKVPHGYNMTDGGEGLKGRHISAASRERMAASHRGKTISPETREKIAASLRGYRHTDEMRELVRKAGMGRKFSDSTKAKIGDGVRRAALLRNGGE